MGPSARRRPLVRVHPGVSRLAVIRPTPIHAHARRRSWPLAVARSCRTSVRRGSGEPRSRRMTRRPHGARPQRGLRLDGVRLHRPRNLSDLRPVVGVGTWRRRTRCAPLLDVGAVAGPAVVASVLEDVPDPTVPAARCRAPGDGRSHTGPGRRGRRRPRGSCSTTGGSADEPPDSALEVAMHRSAPHAPAARGGVPPPRGTRRRRSYELDFAPRRAPHRHRGRRVGPSRQPPGLRGRSRA